MSRYIETDVFLPEPNGAQLSELFLEIKSFNRFAAQVLAVGSSQLHFAFVYCAVQIGPPLSEGGSDLGAFPTAFLPDYRGSGEPIAYARRVLLIAPPGQLHRRIIAEADLWFAEIERTATAEALAR